MGFGQPCAEVSVGKHRITSSNHYYYYYCLHDNQRKTIVQAVVSHDDVIRLCAPIYRRRFTHLHELYSSETDFPYNKRTYIVLRQLSVKRLYWLQLKNARCIIIENNNNNTQLLYFISIAVNKMFTVYMKYHHSFYKKL